MDRQPSKASRYPSQSECCRCKLSTCGGPFASIWWARHTVERIKWGVDKGFQLKDLTVSSKTGMLGMVQFPASLPSTLR